MTWREAGRKAWDVLPLYDEQPPNQSLTELMPEIVGLLGTKSAKAQTSATVSASVAAPGNSRRWKKRSLRAARSTCISRSS